MARNRKAHTVVSEIEDVVEPEPLPLCNASAPLVANGVAFIGCQQLLGHEGNHLVQVSWDR